jgi:hypothetical protein
MGIHIAQILCLAMAMELLAGLACIVGGYFLVRATWHGRNRM